LILRQKKFFDIGLPCGKGMNLSGRRGSFPPI